MYQSLKIRDDLLKLLNSNYQVDGQQEYFEYNNIKSLIDSLTTDQTLTKTDVTTLCVNMLNVIEKSIKSIYETLAQPDKNIEMHSIRKHIQISLASYQSKFKNAIVAYLDNLV